MSRFNVMPRAWTSRWEGSTSWHADIRIGRLQLGYHIHRHPSTTLPDRWVFQPFAIYDRRTRR